MRSVALEVKVVVFLVLVEELAGGYVQRNPHSCVVLESLHQQLKSLLGILGGRRKPSLVSDSRGLVLLFYQLLQVLIDLTALAHRVSETCGLLRADHELLAGQEVVSVFASIDHVEVG